MLPQIIDGVNVGAGQVIKLVLGLGSCRVLPCSYYWGELSSIALTNSPLEDMSGDGNSPTFLPSGLAFPHL